MRITYTFSLPLLGLVAACSAPQPEPAPTPAPAPVAAPAPAPAPVQSGKWIDWPITPGDWVYRSDGRGSLALFGTPNSDATFMIRCDRSAGQIFLSRQGAAPSNAKMTFRASSGLKSFTARNTGSVPAYAAVSVSTDEYMLDRIAFSRGRFAVETTGMRSLAIPIWPEFTRVVEDCRG